MEGRGRKVGTLPTSQPAKRSWEQRLVEQPGGRGRRDRWTWLWGHGQKSGAAQATVPLPKQTPHSPPDLLDACCLQEPYLEPNEPVGTRSSATPGAMEGPAVTWLGVASLQDVALEQSLEMQFLQQAR